MPVANAGGWFDMDNLSYLVVPEPGSLSLLVLGASLLAARKLARRAR